MSGCGSSRPVPAAPSKSKQPTNNLEPRALSGLLDVLTQGRAGQGRAGRAGHGRAGQGSPLPPAPSLPPALPPAPCPLPPAPCPLPPAPCPLPPARGQGGGSGQEARGRGQGAGAGDRAGQGRAGQGRAQQGSIFAHSRKKIRGTASLQSSCTRRLYPPSPCCRDARPGASVGASSAHANGQRRSRQFRV